MSIMNQTITGLCKGLALVLILLVSACITTQPKTTQPQNELLGYWIQHTTVAGEFAEIKSFLELAIEDRGIKINNVSHIGKMLQRTSTEVGDPTVVYKHAEAIEFCSATLSRNMMKSDPHYIALCPYIIYIYELPQQPGTIHLSYRNPLLMDPTDPSLQAVDQLLRGIIQDLKN